MCINIAVCCDQFCSPQGSLELQKLCVSNCKRLVANVRNVGIMLLIFSTTKTNISESKRLRRYTYCRNNTQNFHP